MLVLVLVTVVVVLAGVVVKPGLAVGRTRTK